MSAMSNRCEKGRLGIGLPELAAVASGSCRVIWLDASPHVHRSAQDVGSGSDPWQVPSTIINLSDAGDFQDPTLKDYSSQTMFMNPLCSFKVSCR